jgi:hypothetical protein
MLLVVCSWLRSVAATNRIPPWLVVATQGGGCGGSWLDGGVWVFLYLRPLHSFYSKKPSTAKINPCKISIYIDKIIPEVLQLFV